jgi:phosphatidylinositol alpha-1,6-mannosyltransferase
MRPRVAVDVLGLFPPTPPGAVGGIQVSGQLAWTALAAGPGSTHLFCGDHRRPGRGPLEPYGKARAVAEALGRRWAARVVLVWHLGLLKLVPLLRLPPGRVVVFLHGIEAWRRQDLLTRTLLRRVGRFLTNSDHTWARFAALHPGLAGAAHQTVHLGIGAPATGPVRPPDAVPAALMLGRLARGEDYKGHRELIAAWPRVRERVPDAELWIAGEGDVRPELERLAAAGPVRRAVRFWGLVSEAQKQELLTRARCLALPSGGEGFGLVYLEAMRLGRPCLVGDADAGREVVAPPECGLAARPADPAALAAAAAALLAAGPAWDARSARARRRYEGAFTAEHFARRLVAAVAAADRVPA